MNLIATRMFALETRGCCGRGPITKIVTPCIRLRLATVAAVREVTLHASSKTWLARTLDQEALNRMQKRVTPEAMRLRRSTVEHPFAMIKYRIFGHPRFLLRRVVRCEVEFGFATMAYNLKRITNVLGAIKLTEALHHA